MIFEVFRQEQPGEYHTHCGNVHAPDMEMAKLFAQIQHGRRKQTNSLWVVPKQAVEEVDTDDATFGGTTDKSYRFATAYNVDPAAEEVAESEDEQRQAQTPDGGDSP
ncbi:MAG: 1,2-phenylacetyl-CoA epoxidase subunit PaaB [Halobacteriaceae archaeon]